MTNSLHAVLDVHSSFITSRDGLTHNTIRYIFQDSKGFIWISTVNGLNRYDGYSFINFLPEKGNKITIPDNHVQTITEDKNNFLWIASAYDRYSCYDLKNDCFVDYSGCGEYNRVYKNRFEASNGDTWLWDPQNGCRHIKYENGVFSSVLYTKNNGKLPSKQINSLIEDSYGNIWICTDAGLAKVTNEYKIEFVDWALNFFAALNYKDKCFFLTNEGKIYTFEERNGLKFSLKLINESEPFELSCQFQTDNKWLLFTKKKSFAFDLSTQKEAIPSLQIPKGRYIRDNKGNIYMFNGTGQFYLFNIKSEKIKVLQLISPQNINPASGEQYKVVQDKQGLIWITAYGNGLFVFDPYIGEIIHHYTYQEDGHNRVSSNFLNLIKLDRSGNIWIGSEYSGLTRLSVLSEGAIRIYPENEKLTDHSNAIRMLSQLSNGEIWVSTRKGKAYIFDDNLSLKETNVIPFNHLYAIKEDADRRLWMGSRGEGLFLNGKWFKNQKDNESSLAYNHIFHIHRDNNDRMWIGTFGGGLDLVVPKDSDYTFRHFLTNSVGEKEIRIITQDYDNRMWVGTNCGICIFHPDSIIADCNNYLSFSFDNDLFPGNEVKTVFRDSKNQMWVGVHGRGFLKCSFDEKQHQLNYKQYTTLDGLVSNMVEQIIEDKKGCLWVTTEYGVSRFDPKTERFENYFFSTSIQGNVYNGNCAIILDNGNLLFGTNFGMVLVNPNKVSVSSVTSNVTFTNLKINGVSVHPKEMGSPLVNSLTYTKSLKLNHNASSFTIEFSTLEYSMMNEILYSYKLDNADDDWSIPTSLNFATYKKLNPGKYKLQVKACNAAGVWSENESTLFIEVLPPFWKTYWAYLIYTLFFAMLLYVAFQIILRFNRLQNRLHIEKQLTEYKLMFFTNISHEFRTPLTLIKGAIDKIIKDKKYSKELNYPIQLMNKNTNRMLRLVNQLLEFRKVQKGKLTLQLEKIDVVSFIKELSVNFEELAKEKSINFHFNSSSESYDMYIDKGKIDKIIYNLLSNAFKYTPNGGAVVLSIIIDEKEEKLLICVEDTGVGIPKEKQKELFSRFMQSSFSDESVGIGLHLTKELVNGLKGDITFLENKNGGSVFTVSLPLDSCVYQKGDFLKVEDAVNYGEGIEREGKEHLEVSLPSTMEAPLNKKRLLIIEDDKDIRTFLETTLLGYFEVETAADGVFGLKVAQEEDFDLIICDILMPGMNGFIVTRKLKENFETSHIPVVLLTAMGATEDEIEGVESGADAYIIKPFSMELLLVRVFQLIEQREKLKMKFSKDPTAMNPILCSTEVDKKFVARLKAVVDKNLSNPDFSIDDFSSALGLGRTVFFRKIKGITGHTPKEYIRILRMKKAMVLLLEGKYNISEVAFRVGMNDPLYFSKCFKSQFGASPSEYVGGRKNPDFI